jgi:hypothetical protein
MRTALTRPTNGHPESILSRTGSKLQRSGDRIES